MVDHSGSTHVCWFDEKVSQGVRYSHMLDDQHGFIDFALHPNYILGLTSRREIFESKVPSDKKARACHLFHYLPLAHNIQKIDVGKDHKSFIRLI